MSARAAEAHNPCGEGTQAGLLSLIPFVALVGFFLLVAREKLLAPQSPA